MIGNNCGEYVHTRSKNERGIRVLNHRQVRRLTKRSYQLSETFVLIYASYTIVVLNMNTSHQYTKENFCIMSCVTVL